MTQPLSIDLAKLETHLSRTQSQLQNGFMRWVSQRFVINLGVAYFLFVVLPAAATGNLSRILDFTGRRIWPNLIGPAAFAILITMWSVWFTRRQLRRGPSGVARQIEREYTQLTARGWLRKVLTTGLVMALAVGLPVGGLLAVVFQTTDLPLGSRLLTVPIFFALTLLWTVPMAFALRWMTLRYHRRWVQSG